MERRVTHPEPAVTAEAEYHGAAPFGQKFHQLLYIKTRLLWNDY